MTKQIIIDWHPAYITAAQCNVRGQQVQLSKVSRQSVAADDETVGNAATALKAAVSEIGAGKADVTVVAARELIEVRTLSVPRIDNDELPDIIRFQAQRQLASMSDSWTLDYVMLPEEPGQEMQTALVGAISPDHLRTIEQTCAAANLNVSHVALGPIEIARYAVASGDLSGQGICLVVCLSRQHANLLILKGNQVVLVRNTKLPSETTEWSTALAGEVRRSLMAASSQLGSQPLGKALLMAAPDLAATAEPIVAEATGVQVSLVDPGQLLPAKFSDDDDLVHNDVHRLAALAGAALHPTASPSTKLDFKNPKRRPPKKKNTLLIGLAATAAVLVVLAGVSWWINTNRNLDNELADFESEIEGKQLVADSARKKINQLAEIEQFLDSSPNFLDELTYISKRIPAADKVILGSPTFSTLSDGRAQIRVPLAADSAATISQFEDSLRDEQHTVKGKENRKSSQPTDLYKWEAVETITVSGRGWNLVDQPANTGSVAADNSNSTASSAADSPPAASESSEASTSSAAPAATDVAVRNDEEESRAEEPDQTTGETGNAEPAPQAAQSVEAANGEAQAAADLAASKQPQSPPADARRGRDKGGNESPEEEPEGP